jgi:hypothetical protein
MPKEKRPTPFDALFMSGLAMMFTSSKTKVITENDRKWYWTSYNLIRIKMPLLFDGVKDNTIYKKIKNLEDIGFIEINTLLSKRQNKTFISLTPLGEKYLGIDSEGFVDSDFDGGSDDSSEHGLTIHPNVPEPSDDLSVGPSDKTSYGPSDDSSDIGKTINIREDVKEGKSMIDYSFFIPFINICKNFKDACERVKSDDTPEQMRKLYKVDEANSTMTVNLANLGVFKRLQIVSIERLDNIPLDKFEAFKSYKNTICALEHDPQIGHLVAEYAQLLDNKYVLLQHKYEADVLTMDRHIPETEVYEFIKNTKK